MTPAPADPRFPDPVLALADGEAGFDLPPVDTPAPRLAARLRHQAQLRRATADAWAPAPCPDAVRAQVLALMDPDQTPTANRPPALRFAPKLWHRYAVAASVLLAVGLGTVIGAQGWYFSESAVAADYLADALVARADHCAHNAKILAASEVCGADVRQLDGAVAKKLGQATPFGLDLSAVGYTYDQTGTCTLPGPQSVQILYHGPHGRTLSLWVRRDDGRMTGAPGRVRVVVPPGQPEAVASWRQNGLDYHLVAPDLAELERVLGAVGGK